ncbi:TPA_asm: hypothetical protein vir335_00076 [Classicovirus victor]|uniref:Uncharacterized protein n=1 Tax=Caudoviricetes sp. vir335 TaxID=3068357 RepID=A0AA87CI15_9CAUD|nr:TPA_asm: hypothetical protein vir335_00076 [Caudoviricetes sp. vir335]
MTAVVKERSRVLGLGTKTYEVTIIKPRSVISDVAYTMKTSCLPDGRYLLDYQYRSGNSFGMTSKGTMSGRTYYRRRSVAVDSIEWQDKDGNVLKVDGL